jgi:hypothetical protein
MKPIINPELIRKELQIVELPITPLHALQAASALLQFEMKREVNICEHEEYKFLTHRDDYLPILEHIEILARVRRARLYAVQNYGMQGAMSHEEMLRCIEMAMQDELSRIIYV